MHGRRMSQCTAGGRRGPSPGDVAAHGWRCHHGPSSPAALAPAAPRPRHTPRGLPQGHCPLHPPRLHRCFEPATEALAMASLGPVRSFWPQVAHVSGHTQQEVSWGAQHKKKEPTTQRSRWLEQPRDATDTIRLQGKTPPTNQPRPCFLHPLSGPSFFYVLIPQTLQELPLLTGPHHTCVTPVPPASCQGEVRTSNISLPYLCAVVSALALAD